jgi:hypothetical protein
LVSLLTTPLRVFVDGLLWPFRTLPPLAGLAVVSLLSAVGMLLVIRATSDQQGLVAVKRRIQARLFEMRLFSDDLVALLRAQTEMLRANLAYLRLSLVPTAWLLVPFFLLVAQLQFHYGYSGLTPGAAAVVAMRLAGGQGTSSAPALRLEASDGVRVETPPVWNNSVGEAAWRIRAERPGNYELTVHVGNTVVTKSLVVSSEVVRRSPWRVSAVLDQLLYPAEAPLGKDTHVEWIEVTYPERSIELLGLDLHWIIVFFVLSLAFAYALRKRMRVTF